VRVLGLDLGSKRIGVALSDTGGVLATPYDVITRSGDPARDRQAVVDLATEVGAGHIVVGLPLSLDGSLGPAARAALAEVDALAALTDVPVETYDERFTTVTADRSLRAMDVKGAARRQVVDQLAATVMLQAWLDQQSLTARAGGGPDTPTEMPSDDHLATRTRSRRRRVRRPKP
jgi:putative holliday junction resolvase